MKFSGINRSWLLSLAMAIGVAVFLFTADVVDINKADNGDSPQANARPTQESKPQEIPSVHARSIQAETIRRTLTLYGRTEADRVITISAEMPARVVGVNAKRGEYIEAGQKIASLRKGSLPAQIKSAEAQLKLARQEYRSALALNKNNHLPDNTLTQREVAVAQAESMLEQLKVRLDNTQVKTPVTGILNQRFVELGDYIDTGKAVAEILDLDPLVIRVDVPQKDISAFSIGDSANIRFIDGHKAEGKIRYINHQADASTRTFSVELAVANPGMALPAGLSVEADLLKEEISAIEVSPAILALSEVGEPGIKWVDDNDVVHFSPVDIVKSTSNSIWLSGIPEQARVITRGHGFVRVGDKVTVVSNDLVAAE
ncbi:efflux RND transporter periplasmic adaptor subunit [Endozoicomonadaceae bacterium StTr2]